MKIEINLTCAVEINTSKFLCSHMRYMTSSHIVIFIIIMVMGWLITIPCLCQGVNTEDSESNDTIDSGVVESSATTIHETSQNLST